MSADRSGMKRAIHPASRGNHPVAAGRPRHPVVDVLVDAVAGAEPAADPASLERVARIVDLPADDVLDVADAHRVTPALARHLAGVDGVAPDLAAALADERTEQVLRHLSTLADLGPLAAALDGADVPWVVVKGPVAAATIWPAPDMRGYYDLDVVVHPARFADAIDLLLDLGAEQLDLNWGLVRRQMRAELSFVLPHGTLLDLHWHPVNGAALRRRLRWDVTELLARRRRVDVGSVRLPALDPVDTFLHLAYHATHSGAYRLLWLADVAHGLRAAGDPAEVARRAADARLGLLVRAVTDRADAVLGPLPQVPWADRRGAVWRAALRAIDARDEVPRPAATGRTGRSRYRCIQVGTAGSLGALVAEAVGPALRSLGRPVEENPLHVPDGDDAARREYLAAVARQR